MTLTLNFGRDLNLETYMTFKQVSSFITSINNKQNNVKY